MPEIIVQGSAEARLMPTDAHLTVTVQTRSPRDQAEAVSACARRAEEVDAIVADARAGLVRAVVVSSLRTGPEYEHEPRGTRRLVGHVATRTSELVCLPEGEGLTALVGALSRLDDVAVAGPDWRVADDAPGWDEVRAAAATDARRRADAYASGLGVSVGRPTVIAEPGLRLPGGGGGMPMAYASKRSGMADMAGGEGDGPTAVAIAPEPVAVSVTVEVGFDLT